MPEKLVIHPLNRGTRPVRIELETEAGRVVKAKAGTTYYWDFTSSLQGKDPLDAVQLTQRTSGADFVSHAVAACRALEDIAGIKPSGMMKLTRNILLSLDMVHGHITHFYQNVLPDYIPYPGGGPFHGGVGDFRLPADAAGLMLKNMWKSFEIRRLVQKMMAVAGGKAPHIFSVIFGAVTYRLNTSDIVKMASVLKEISLFINNEYSDDLARIEDTYREYFQIGAGTSNFLAVGEFPQKEQADFLIPAKAAMDFIPTDLEKNRISVDYSGSWFEIQDGQESSPLTHTTPVPGKPGGYSWVKGAVYDSRPHQVGAMARMVLAGNPVVARLGNRAASVLGRYRARLEESRMLVKLIAGWLEQLDPEENPAAEAAGLPKEGEAVGFAEASQGSVAHYVSIRKRKIERYNVLDPFSWNLCPTTRNGLQGPVEQALVGTAVSGPDVPVETLRVVRSF